MVTVGVLALQGDFREHVAAVEALGAEATEVRKPEQLDGIDGLVIPGGESTTIGRLARLYGLVDPLRKHIESGLPTLGTCAGMIFLASATTDREQDQLGVLDVTVQRNAFGRQNESFEADLEVLGSNDPVHAVFIRAPWIERVGPDVEVLASWADHPVMVRQEHILATSFHPELTGEQRIHGMLLDLVD